MGSDDDGRCDFLIVADHYSDEDGGCDGDEDNACVATIAMHVNCGTV